MAEMCKPRWKMALFIFIHLLLFTKGKPKSRLSFQNGFSSLSSVVFLDAAREQFAGENIVCAAANDSNYANYARREARHLLKQGLSTTQTQLLHILSDFYCCPAMSNLILATMRVELNKQTRRQSLRFGDTIPRILALQARSKRKKSGGVCAFVNSNFKCFQLKELSYITEFGFHQL